MGCVMPIWVFNYVAYNLLGIRFMIYLSDSLIHVFPLPDDLLKKLENEIENTKIRFLDFFGIKPFRQFSYIMTVLSVYIAIISGFFLKFSITKLYLTIFGLNIIFIIIIRYIVFFWIKKNLPLALKWRWEQVKKKMKPEERKEAERFLEEYKKKYGLKNLAKIFFRFKPLFLAFKTNSGLKPIINKIRKLADIYHVPMKPDFLNDITAMIKKGEHISEDDVKKGEDSVQKLTDDYSAKIEELLAKKEKDILTV